jgi:hypothetical protein
VADGAAGLPSAVEEIWPRADRQHCAVHRLRNLQANRPRNVATAMCLTAKLADECVGSRCHAPIGRPVALRGTSVTDICNSFDYSNLTTKRTIGPDSERELRPLVLVSDELRGAL